MLRLEPKYSTCLLYPDMHTSRNCSLKTVPTNVGCSRSIAEQHKHTGSQLWFQPTHIRKSSSSNSSSFNNEAGEHLFLLMHTHTHTYIHAYCMCCYADQTLEEPSLWYFYPESHVAAACSTPQWKFDWPLYAHTYTHTRIKLLAAVIKH